MNKNAYIISTALVVLLIIAGYVAFGRPKPAVAPTIVETTTPTTTVNIGVSEQIPSDQGEMKKAKVTIKFTDAGFSPNSVTVNLGDTVEWINETDKDMWIASAPHPSHIDYPGFDELKTAGKGETYSFTFTKPGSWKFHNHKMPSAGGVVIVK